MILNEGGFIFKETNNLPLSLPFKKRYYNIPIFFLQHKIALFTITSQKHLGN